jgi:hypothetical protein
VNEGGADPSAIPQAPVTAAPSDGLDWSDAAVGAGIAARVAMLGAGGLGLTHRRRRLATQI